MVSVDVHALQSHAQTFLVHIVYYILHFMYTVQDKWACALSSLDSLTVQRKFYEEILWLMTLMQALKL